MRQLEGMPWHESPGTVICGQLQEIPYDRPVAQLEPESSAPAASGSCIVYKNTCIYLLWNFDSSVILDSRFPS
jgi:hypothetical protein